ncbi:MAG: hypothetical protein HKL96_04160 [Phycisphaerales bacterium]|nr:hypothetical protein [Phycisphaerales bacterium]
MNDLEYRRRQLQQLQDSVVNLEDLANNISITDMTLNDFRMDLSDYIKAHVHELEAAPPGAYAITASANIPETQPGVIFCLRNELPKAVIDSTYALAPHYLVYVLENGEICQNFPQAKKILDLLKKLALGKSQPDTAAVSAFNVMTKNGADMQRYQSLLAKAIAAITGKADEKGIESLFQPGGTVINRDKFRGADDFEVVAYLAILPEPRRP